VSLSDRAPKRNSDDESPSNKTADYLIRKIADEFSISYDHARAVALLAFGQEARQ
jgi:hypothetical protein